MHRPYAPGQQQSRQPKRRDQPKHLRRVKEAKSSSFARKFPEHCGEPTSTDTEFSVDTAGRMGLTTSIEEADPTAYRAGNICSRTLMSGISYLRLSVQDNSSTDEQPNYRQGK